jgi:hypothetical protein
VDLAALRAALIAAVQFGIPGAVPDTRKGNTADRRERLLAQTGSVLREMGSRFDRATAATEPVVIARAVFGEDFVLVPRFRPVDDGELAQAIAEGPALSGGPIETRRWMQGAARVHAGLARWRRLALYASALNAPVADGEVAQLPHVAGARWVASPFASENERPPSGRVSMVMHREQKPAVGDPWAGLLLDEWPELIPNNSELTGVTFHYDDPGAEAAQAVLIAIPPTPAKRWDLPTLVDTLHETLDLIKMRAVDGDLLGELGHLLPAVYLAANAAGDTVATDFSGRRSTDPKIVLN